MRGSVCGKVCFWVGLCLGGYVYGRVYLCEGLFVGGCVFGRVCLWEGVILEDVFTAMAFILIIKKF